MADSTQEPETRSWRKRHPVVSRLILYVLGIGIMAVLVHLFLERQAVDEQDRYRAVAQELDGIGVIHLLDPDGSQILKLLDEKFSAPDLPPKVKGRALRWRALALRKRPDHEGAEAALVAAKALDVPAEEHLALGLEWAVARIEAGQVETAHEVLPTAAEVAPYPALQLLRALLFAQLQEQVGRQDAGAAELEAQLGSLKAPLVEDVLVYVGGREWSALQVATVATEYLAARPGAPVAELWRRLARLAPRDLDAQVACARGFLAAGLEAEARSAWDRVQALDPRLAAALAAKEPELGALGSN